MKAKQILRAEALCLMALLCLSCAKAELSSMSGAGYRGMEMSLEEAEDFFNTEYGQISELSFSQEMQDYYNGHFVFNIGRFSPVWENSESGFDSNSGLYKVIVPIGGSEVRILSKAKLYTGEDSVEWISTATATSLLVTKNPENGNKQSFLLFETNASFGAKVAIYTSLEGYLVRIVREDKAGNKKGILLSGMVPGSTEYDRKCNLLQGLLSDVRFARVDARKTKNGDTPDVDDEDWIDEIYGGCLKPAIIVGDAKKHNGTGDGSAEGGGNNDNYGYDWWGSGSGSGSGSSDISGSGGGGSGSSSTSGSNDEKYNNQYSSKILNYNRQQYHVPYEKGGCFKGAKSFLANFGAQPCGSDKRIDIYCISNGTVQFCGTNSMIFAVSYGISQLDMGLPFVVGVSKSGFKELLQGNANHLTQHFIVITGYTETGTGKFEFTYYETGRSENKWEDATSPSNKMYYNENTGEWYGYSWHEHPKKYTVTEIRTNY